MVLMMVLLDAVLLCNRFRPDEKCSSWAVFYSILLALLPLIHWFLGSISLPNRVYPGRK